jgi:transketolase
VKNAVSGVEKPLKIALFRKAGEVAGARRAISEIVKWLNHVTGNRVLTSPRTCRSRSTSSTAASGGTTIPRQPARDRLKAAIQEAGNVSSAVGLVGQSASVDPDTFAGVWAFSGTYGAFTPLMYTPARVWSQQNQDSKFRTGVLHILAGHSGPETAADARTHFGIFAPQVWKLFPRDQVINLSFWDYNDVAPGYFAAAEIAAAEKKVGLIVIEVARPDFRVADRATFADTDVRAAARGLYVIRDFAPGRPRHGYVVAQGSSATFNLVSVLPRLDAAGINVKVIAAISEELFERQPEAYRHAVLPPEARQDLMFVMSGTRRMWPLGTSARSPTSTRSPRIRGRLAHRRDGVGRDRRGAPGSGVDLRRGPALRPGAGGAPAAAALAARRAGLALFRSRPVERARRAATARRGRGSPAGSGAARPARASRNR